MLRLHFLQLLAAVRRQTLPDTAVFAATSVAESEAAVLIRDANRAAAVV